tara:strand:- start:7015 stop:7251 length:237 start_codon:yes stop_codon:yes gene_type:complete
MSYFVLRTDKLSTPHYFVGATEGVMFHTTHISQSIFEAMEFEQRDGAEQAIIELDFDDDFTISEVGTPEVSDSLKGLG